MTMLARALVVMVCLTSVVSGFSRTQTVAPPPLAELLEKTGKYVRGFQQEFSSVISDESYWQHDKVTRDAGLRRASTAERRMESEMLFQWTPAERTWLLVRSVLKVDQKAIPDSRARLDRVLSDASPGAQGRLRQLRDEGARFNVGIIRRNMNDPMLPLQIVDPSFQQRFTFTIEGAERIGGVETWKVIFAEEMVPTLVEIDNRNSRAHGALWVTASGIILRTRLELNDEYSNLSVSMVVNYGRDAKLGGWVPVRMDERYEQRKLAGYSGAEEEIVCVATYSNFRRFETSARILK
jgi:hypothetical protein